MWEAFKNVPLPKEFYTDSKENNLTKPWETPDTVKEETKEKIKPIEAETKISNSFKTAVEICENYKKLSTKELIKEYKKNPNNVIIQELLADKIEYIKINSNNSFSFTKLKNENDSKLFSNLSNEEKTNVAEIYSLKAVKENETIESAVKRIQEKKEKNQKTTNNERLFLILNSRKFNLKEVLDGQNLVKATLEWDLSGIANNPETQEKLRKLGISNEKVKQTISQISKIDWKKNPWAKFDEISGKMLSNPVLMIVWLIWMFKLIFWDSNSKMAKYAWIPMLMALFGATGGWKLLEWFAKDMGFEWFWWDDETQTSSTTSSETKLNTQEQANFNKIKENSPHSEMNQDTYSAVLSLKNDTSPNNWFKNNEQLINWTFEYIAKNTEFLSKNIDWALDNKWKLKAEYFTAAWFVEWKDFILVAWLKLTRIDFERFVKKLIQRRDISSASEKTFWDLFKENKESETSFDFSIDWVSKWWEQTNWVELWVTSITVFKTLTSKTWFGAIFWWALSVANITDLSDLIKNENFQKFSKSLEKFGENISAWEFIKAFSESFWIEETKITEKINTVIDLPFYAYWKFKEWFNQASWTELVLTALPWFMVFKSSKIAWKLFWAAVTTMQITDVTSLIQNENIKKLSKNFEKAWKDIDEWEIVKAFKDIFNFTDEKIEEIKNSDIKIEKVDSKEETSISSPETTSISKEIKDTESSIKTIESEIQKLKSELENKESDYKTATPSKKSELKNEISELKTQISGLNETLNWLKITLANQKEEEETLKDEKQKEEINKNAEKYIQDYDKIDLYFTKTIPEFNLDKITSNEWNLATANEIKKFITELDNLEKNVEAWDNEKIKNLKQKINLLQKHIRNYKENLKKEINSYYETNNQYIEKVDSIDFSASDFEVKNKDLIDYFNADKSLEKNISYIKNIFWTKFYNETNFNAVKEKYKEIIETKLKKAWINLEEKEGLLIIANALKLNISINENSFYQNLDKAKENEQKIKAEKKYISEFNEYLSNTDIINSKEPNILLEKYNKYLSITSSIDLESDTEISKTISSIDEKITKMKSYLISNKSNILKKLETSKDINDYNKVKKLYKEFVWLDIEQDLLKIPYYKESQRPKELGLVEQAKSIKEIQAIINTRPNLKNKIIEIVKQRNIEDIVEIKNIFNKDEEFSKSSEKTKSILYKMKISEFLSLAKSEKWYETLYKQVNDLLKLGTKIAQTKTPKTTTPTKPQETKEMFLDGQKIEIKNNNTDKPIIKYKWKEYVIRWFYDNGFFENFDSFFDIIGVDTFKKTEIKIINDKLVVKINNNWKIWKLKIEPYIFETMIAEKKPYWEEWIWKDEDSFYFTINENKDNINL